MNHDATCLKKEKVKNNLKRKEKSLKLTHSPEIGAEVIGSTCSGSPRLEKVLPSHHSPRKLP